MFLTTNTERAITTFVNVFILIPGRSRYGNLFGVIADLADLRTRAVSALFSQLIEEIAFPLLDQGVVEDANRLRTHQHQVQLLQSQSLMHRGKKDVFVEGFDEISDRSGLYSRASHPVMVVCRTYDDAGFGGNALELCLDVEAAHPC